MDQKEARWGRIHAFLEAWILDYFTDATLGRKWLAGLAEDDQGMRLGSCLAIDYIANAIDLTLLHEALVSISADFGSSRDAFSWAIDRLGQRRLCSSKAKTDKLGEADRYVRVMEIGNFTEFYGAPFSKTLNPADVKWMRNEFQGKTIDLSKISAPWRGALPSVWVMSAIELESRIKDSDSPGTAANSALGLGLPDGWSDNGRPDMVAVSYPPGFETSCVQPTSFDNCWDRQHYYVSHRSENGWGLTHSLTISDLPCNERVHSALDGLGQGYGAWHIGESREIQADLDSLLDTAFRRFEAATGESPHA